VDRFHPAAIDREASDKDMLDRNLLGGSFLARSRQCYRCKDLAPELRYVGFKQ
jgi:hypothetical protein